jgi:dTDP-4-amino-4,6-dideoxygalactose transaminase
MNKGIARIRIPQFDEQADKLMEAVRSGYLARGPHLEQLSEELGRFVKKKYVVLTTNGFSALFATLKSVCVGSERVITAPASTCFAIVNAIKAAGCVPNFLDMDMASASIAAIENPLDAGCIAVVPDHFGIVAPICGGMGLRPKILIEDAAQAFLSLCGMETKADVIVLSLYPTKVLNGIDGGAVLTDDYEIYQRVQKVVSYVDQFEDEEPTRYNLGMNNINAAFALGTISNLDYLRRVLLQLHGRFTDVLKRRDIRTLTIGKTDVPTRFIVVADDEKQRNTMMTSFNQAGIPANCELMPVCPPDRVDLFPMMRRLVSTTLSIPFYASMSERDIDKIEKTIVECL